MASAAKRTIPNLRGAVGNSISGEAVRELGHPFRRPNLQPFDYPALVGQYIREGRKLRTDCPGKSKEGGKCDRNTSRFASQQGGATNVGPRIDQENANSVLQSNSAEFWDEALQAIGEAIPRMVVADVAAIAMSICKVSANQKLKIDVFREMQSHLMQNTTSLMVSINARDCGNLAMAYSHLNDKRIHIELIEHVINPRIMLEIQLRNGEGASAWQASSGSDGKLGDINKVLASMEQLDLDGNFLVRLLNAYAKAEWRFQGDSKEILNFLMSEAQEWVPELYPRELSGIGLSLAKLLEKNLATVDENTAKDVFSSIQEHSIETLSEFNGQDCTNTIGAFQKAEKLKIHNLSNDFLNAITNQIKSGIVKAAKEGRHFLDSQQVANLIWIYGVKLNDPNLKMLDFLFSPSAEYNPNSSISSFNSSNSSNRAFSSSSKRSASDNGSVVARIKFPSTRELTNVWTVLSDAKPLIAHDLLIPQLLKCNRLSALDLVPLLTGYSKILGSQIVDWNTPEDTAFIDMLGKFTSNMWNRLDYAQCVFAFQAFSKLHKDNGWTISLISDKLTTPFLDKLSANQLAMLLNASTNKLRLLLSPTISDATQFPILKGCAVELMENRWIGDEATKRSMASLFVFCEKLLERFSVGKFNRDFPESGKYMNDHLRKVIRRQIGSNSSQAELRAFLFGKKFDLNVTNILQSLVFLTDCYHEANSKFYLNHVFSATKTTINGRSQGRYNELAQTVVRIVIEDADHFSSPATFIHSVYASVQLLEKMQNPDKKNDHRNCNVGAPNSQRNCQSAGGDSTSRTDQKPVTDLYQQHLLERLSTLDLSDIRIADCVALCNILAITQHFDISLLDRVSDKFKSLLISYKDGGSNAPNSANATHIWQFCNSLAKLPYRPPNVVEFLRSLCTDLRCLADSNANVRAADHAAILLASLARLDITLPIDGLQVVTQTSEKRCDKLGVYLPSGTDMRSNTADPSFMELLLFGYGFHAAHSRNGLLRFLYVKNMLQLVTNLFEQFRTEHAARDSETASEGSSQVLTGLLMFMHVLCGGFHPFIIGGNSSVRTRNAPSTPVQRFQSLSRQDLFKLLHCYDIGTERLQRRFEYQNVAELEDKVLDSVESLFMKQNIMRKVEPQRKVQPYWIDIAIDPANAS